MTTARWVSLWHSLAMRCACQSAALLVIAMSPGRGVDSREYFLAHATRLARRYRGATERWTAAIERRAVELRQPFVELALQAEGDDGNP